MIRSIIVVFLWIITFGIFTVRIVFNDGLEIYLKGWPDAIRDLIKKIAKSS